MKFVKHQCEGGDGSGGGGDERAEKQTIYPKLTSRSESCGKHLPTL
jgi:hypothetical protein